MTTALQAMGGRGVASLAMRQLASDVKSSSYRIDNNMGRRGRGRVARKRQEEDKPDTDNDRECSFPSSSTSVDDVPETQVEVTKSQLESTDEEIK